MIHTKSYINTLPVEYQRALTRHIYKQAKLHGIPIGDMLTPLMFGRISDTDNIISPHAIKRLINLINNNN